MNVREYIPGTQARRDRLFSEILSKEIGSCDGLALVEWEDGSVTMRPVNWESGLSALIDPDSGDIWFARGRGAEPKRFNGVPVWRVYAGNAGVISTEACLIGDQERWGDVVDVGAGDQIPDDLVDAGLEDPNVSQSDAEETEHFGGLPASTDSNEVEADGGVVDEIDDHAAVYDLRPPEGYDGITIDVRDADDFDPYPVTRSDAKAAAEWFEQAVDDGTDTWMKGFIVGLLVFAAIWLLMTLIPWLLGEIGGGGGGGGGSTITGTLPLMTIGYRHLLARFKEVFE